jgi:long-chain fatty acid transport protein
MKLRILTMAATSASLLALSATAAHAAGFYIQEQSVKGLGSAFSGSTTSLDDASTVYFNPAGMTKLEGPQINAGVHLLIPHGDLENTGSTIDLNGPAPGGVAAVTPASEDNPYDPTPVPNLYAAAPFGFGGEEIWLGLGVTAPFGLANDYGDDAFNRYDSIKTELLTVNVAPSIAYAPSDWFSIGGGIDVQYADAELTSAFYAGSEGRSSLEGDDVSVGYNIGVLLRPLYDTEIGIHYRSAISHELDGDISVTGAGSPLANFSSTGSADLDLPDIATFGIAHQATDRLRLMGQATWFGWNNFEDIDAELDNPALTNPAPIVQNYQTTWAFSVGAEYDLTPQWTIRGGYQFDETPTTDEYRTSRTPDGDRNWFSAGATYKWNEQLSFDLAATYIDVAEEEISVTRNNALFPATVNADTDGSVGIVAVGLNYKF